MATPGDEVALTYYGYRVRFSFLFGCGCTRQVGPLFERHAFMHGNLGDKQRCGAHGAWEVSRTVERIDGPHGHYTLGWWRRLDGTGILLTWEPATGWVRVGDLMGRRIPDDWPRGDFVKIDDENTIWRVVGGDHLGGDRPELADEILERFRQAGTADDRLGTG